MKYSRVRLHRQPFLQGSLQFLEAALEILNFPGRATIPRPLGLLLSGNSSHITLRFRRTPLPRMLEKLHPVHRLLHRLRLTIKGMHPRILILGPVTQSGNGLGRQVWELREGPVSQGEHPVRPLAEGLPTALHCRLKVQLVCMVQRKGSKALRRCFLRMAPRQPHGQSSAAECNTCWRCPPVQSRTGHVAPLQSTVHCARAS